MENIAKMETIDGSNDLAEDPQHLALGKGRSALLVVEESPVAGKVHDQVDPSLGLKNIPKMDDMRVLVAHVELNFAFQKLRLVLPELNGEVDLGKSMSTILTAYLLRVVRCVARRTTPNEPVPSGLSDSSMRNSSMLRKMPLDIKFTCIPIEYSLS